MNYRTLIIISTFIFAQIFIVSVHADIVAASAPWAGNDLNGTPCTGNSGGYGPYDYTNSEHRANNLRIVEGSHFTKEVESLKKGHRGYLTQDLDYTIRAFPNHHRALYAMMRYQLKQPRPVNAKYAPIECYFKRAIRFQPNDYRVMQLYASYLVKKKHPKMAIDVYNQALSVNNVPLDINYSLGLLYFDLKEYDMAVEQAKIAYAGGIKKSKLKSQLKKINRWPDV